GRQEQVKARRDAGWREAHRRAPALRVGTVTVGLFDERLQSALAWQVEQFLDVGDGLREAAAVVGKGDDGMRAAFGDPPFVACDVARHPEQEAWVALRAGH